MLLPGLERVCGGGTGVRVMEVERTYFVAGNIQR